MLLCDFVLLLCLSLQENSKRWTMKLDICAPQVIFPDDFQSQDPMLVVVDLGRILLTNSQGKISSHLRTTHLTKLILSKVDSAQSAVL